MHQSATSTYIQYVPFLHGEIIIIKLLIKKVGNFRSHYTDLTTP